MLQRFQGALQVLAGRASASATTGRIMSAVGAEAQYRWPDLGQVKNQKQQFVDSSLVYIAIMRILLSIGTIEFLASKDGVRLKQHWLLDLLRKPNSWMSQFELIAHTFGEYFITGNSYWYMNGHTEIIPLRSDRVRIVAGPDTQTYIRGYIYTVNSVDIPLLPADVMHNKTYHPLDDFYGLSPLVPATLPVQSDLAMSRFNRGWFSQNNGVPPNMVSIDPNVTDTEFERLQDDWQHNYSTNNRERKTAFIRGGAITYTDMSHTNKEMEFLSGRKLNKEEVMLIYGIPPGVLDVNATEANALAGKEVFTEQTLWPNLVMFAQKLTTTFTESEGVLIEPRDIRVKDATAMLREMQATAAIMSADEQRAKYLDMEPATWPGHDKPTAGADAPIPGPVGAKPNIDKSPEQIQRADAEASQSAASPFKADFLLEAGEGYKGLETDEQRKWWFANLGAALSGGGRSAAHAEAMGRMSKRIKGNYGAGSDAEAISALDKTGNAHEIERHLAAEHYAAIKGGDHPEDAAYLTQQHDNQSLQSRDINRAIGEVGSGTAEQSTAKKGEAILNAPKPTSGRDSHMPDAFWRATQKQAYAHYSTHTSDYLRNRPANSSAAMKALDADPVTRTGPIRDEIKKFRTFAGKGKSVETFRFNHSPRSIEIAYKAQADINELDYLTAKAILPASARISISGVRDPNAKEKEASATTLASAFHAALTDLQASIVDGVKHVASGDEQAYLDYFDSKWWKSALATFVSSLYGSYYDALELAAQDSADISSVQSGVGFDDASLAPLVRDAADSWSANWLPGIVQTTRAAVEAMLSRWASALNAKIADLVSAVQESPVFGEDRATLAGETENTSLWMMAAYIGDKVVTGALQGVSAEQVDDISHPHPGCVCYVLNGVWYAVHDGHKICETCSGRDGKTLQEIQDGGL